MARNCGKARVSARVRACPAQFETCSFKWFLSGASKRFLALSLTVVSTLGRRIAALPREICDYGDDSTSEHERAYHYANRARVVVGMRGSGCQGLSD
eukprot:12194070-Alexandrium_andersonii.AAC.2